MPISLSALAFLKQQAKEVNPKVSVLRGSYFHDVILAPAAILLEQYTTDLEDAFGEGASLENAEFLTEDRVDAIVSRFLLSRREGAKASQLVRIFVQELRDYSLSEGEVIATDSSGNTFYNTDPLFVDVSTLRTQRSGLLYYFDLPMDSESEGDSFSLVSSIDNSSFFDGFVSVQGIQGTLVQGVARETNEALAERAKFAVSVRDVVTKKGASALLTESFSESVLAVTSIGFGDPEMMRDLPRDSDGVLLFPAHLGSKTDLYLYGGSVATEEVVFRTLIRDTTQVLQETFLVQLQGLTPVGIGSGETVQVVSVATPSGAALSLALFSFDLSNGTILSTVGSTDKVLVTVDVHPLAIDIRRDARTGREAYTIDQLCLLRIESIEELYPGTDEATGFLFRRSGGFGQGGFGQGGFGRGVMADYRLHVKNKDLRFSAREDSALFFHAKHLGKDIRVTYQTAPAWVAIEDILADGSENVTVADILARNMIPIFIDGTLDITPSAGSGLTEEGVFSVIDTMLTGLEEGDSFVFDDLYTALRNAGAKSITGHEQLTGEIHHVDGSVSRLSDRTSLTPPNPVLRKDDRRPISPRICRFYRGAITVLLR